MKELTLENSNKVVIVDDHNFGVLSKFRWYALGRDGHIYRMVKQGLWESLPNTIFGKPGMYDHKDLNQLNNLESNLRPSNYSLNNANRTKIRFKCTSKYKGVTWHKRIRQWQSRVGFNKKRLHLGYFDVEHKAAVAYDVKAKELFGEHSRLNFPVLRSWESAIC
jgi:hypothetical protein